ncbi:DUF1254 domain-containing protein [Gandjariella thermophila]|uniref:DUF1254 domain-containing protein n=1 Tax=Gandjariella thermophila TaxID=1931992 RepID=A0A4D4JES4_9PSEU|nr:DUF1254 domain-containing protein [Gandjariella thermophila]GDY32363.1 hypothetical protein GTS_39960 [Gandjariella thermophila]
MATRSAASAGEVIAEAAPPTIPLQRQVVEAERAVASVVRFSARAVGGMVGAVRHPGAVVQAARQVLDALPMITASVKPLVTGHFDDWREEYAYTLGMQAFVYGFPWMRLATLRWRWVTQPDDPDWTPYAALNQFWHMKSPATARHRPGGAPNPDTLCSVAWLDLRDGPVILSHPDMGSRYFCFQLASMDSDNFGYVGTRATGPSAGRFAIAGPDWAGDLPEGVRRLEPSRTPFALLLGRTAVDGPDDVPEVRRLQLRYRLTPLRDEARRGGQSRPQRDVWTPPDERVDPLGCWETMNHAMTENPPEARHAALLNLFATIGVGPGQDVYTRDGATRRGLVRAAYEGHRLLDDALGQSGGRRVNGWQYPPPTMGRAGLHDDFVTRAAVQCGAGIVSHDPEEATYLIGAADENGHPLSGRHRYELRFTPHELPRLHDRGFWSITAYDTDHNLVDNPADRYAIGDRTRDLRYDPDGGLTLYVRRYRPRGQRATNWLPTPADAFYLVLRTYLPGREIVAQTWKPPPLIPW